MLAPAELSTLFRQAGLTVTYMCESHELQNAEIAEEADVRARMPSGVGKATL